MKVHSLRVLETNYVYVCERNKRFIVIDLGESQVVKRFLLDKHGSLEAILLTHHHTDHIDGVEELRRKYNPKLVGAKRDKSRLPALDIEVEDGVLTISGEKSRGMFDETKAKVLRRELKHSSFKRQFELGEELDGKNISAKFEDGILSIDIPKIEPEKPKTNKVKIS